MLQKTLDPTWVTAPPIQLVLSEPNLLLTFSDANYNEFDLATLTNQGDVHIFTPNLRRQLQAQCIKKENIT